MACKITFGRCSTWPASLPFFPFTAQVSKVLASEIRLDATGLRPKITYLLLIACSMVGAPSPVQAQAPRSPTPAAAKGVVDVQTIAKGLEHPWSLAFLPEKRMLVTERPGRLRLVGPDGRVSEPLTGVPQVYASGQGGLLDVALSTAFDKDRLVMPVFCRTR